MENTDIFVEVQIQNMESKYNVLRQLRTISHKLQVPVMAKITPSDSRVAWQEFRAYPSGLTMYNERGQFESYLPTHDFGKQEREAAKVDEPVGVLRMETTIDEWGTITKHYYLRDGTYLGSEHDIPHLYAGLLTRTKEALALTEQPMFPSDEFHKRNAEGNAAQ